MARRKISLLHRGYLYAQKRIRTQWDETMEPSARRMEVGKAWREGYLAAVRDARKQFPVMRRAGFDK